jgi:predicted ribosome quality control (RQC) complex YloA/Tae2 family protein
MTPAELSALVAELRPLVGARIQKVDVVDDGELVLELRVPGRTLRLLVVTRADAPRVHLVDARPPKLLMPGALQGLLRKYLEGQVLIGLSSIERRLVLDVPVARVSATLGQGAKGFSLQRTRTFGDTRAPDAADDGVPEAPTEAPTDTPTEAPPDTPPEAPTDAALDATPEAAPDAPTLGLTGAALLPVPEHFPTSDALRARYATRVASSRADRLRRALLRPVDAELKRAKRLLERLEGDEAKLRALSEAGRQAELFKPLASRTRRGARQVELTDWETGAPVALALDPALDGLENLERMFSRKKRGERGLAQVARRIDETFAALERLQAERAELAAAPLDVLEARASEARPADALGGGPAERASARTAAIDRCSRRFESADGREIRVGRGARENDRLTFGGARGDDVWLHARGVPGAHVILRVEKGHAPTEQGLLDAAHLAVHYSQAKEATLAEVQWTEAKYVRKVKGAAPGAVAVARERVIALRVEPARLARLLGAARGSP